MTLTDEQLERYARHVILDIVGEKGQLKLLNSKVLVVGAGGLGSPVLLYLAAAGIGTLGIVDFDTVDATNLQRQVIHTEEDVGRAKVISAKETIELLNSEVVVTTYRTRIDADNANEIFAQYDVIVDGSDNFATRYLVNAAAWQLKKPLVSAALSRFEGQLMVLDANHNTPCYQCVFPTAPDLENVSRCDTVGVFGVIAGVLGTLQASEVLKIILNIGQPLHGKMLMIDVLDNVYKTFITPKDKQCGVCGDKA